MKIIYEIDSDKDEFEYKAIKNVDKFYFALDGIYNTVRHQLKHGDEDLPLSIENLLKDIKSYASIIHEVE